MLPQTQGLSQPRLTLPQTQGLSQPLETLPQTQGLSQPLETLPQTQGLSQPLETLPETQGLSQPRLTLPQTQGLSQPLETLPETQGLSQPRETTGKTFVDPNHPSGFFATAQFTSHREKEHSVKHFKGIICRRNRCATDKAVLKHSHINMLIKVSVLVYLLSSLESSYLLLFLSMSCRPSDAEL
ncbi:unnamed protein product [Boreogadus saida]